MSGRYSGPETEGKPQPRMARYSDDVATGWHRVRVVRLQIRSPEVEKPVAGVSDNRGRKPETAAGVAAAVMGDLVAWTDSRKAWSAGSCMPRKHIGLAAVAAALLGTRAFGLVREGQLSYAAGSPTRRILVAVSTLRSDSCWALLKTGSETSSTASRNPQRQYLMSLVGLAVGQTSTLKGCHTETSWDGRLTLRHVIVVVVVVVGTGRMPLKLVIAGRLVLASWRWKEENILRSCRPEVAMEVHSERIGAGSGSESVTYCHNFGVISLLVVQGRS
jgi:hypothetical protein